MSADSMPQAGDSNGAQQRFPSLRLREDFLAAVLEQELVPLGDDALV